MLLHEFYKLLACLLISWHDLHSISFWHVCQQVCTVIWIALIVYKTGLVEQLANLEDSSMSSPATGQQHLHQWGDHPFSSDMMRERSLEQEADSPSLLGKGMWWGRDGGEEPLEAGLVEHTQLEAWRGLSHKHWPRLLALYNISILGRYLSFISKLFTYVAILTTVSLYLRSLYNFMLCGGFFLVFLFFSFK